MKRSGTTSATSAKKLTLLLGIVAFFFAGAWGITHAGMGMYASVPTVSGTQTSAPMSGCIFTDFLHSSASCEMSPIEHITEWQNMLRALLPQKSLFLFFVILFAALLAYAAQKTFRWLRAESVRSAKLRGRFFDHIAFDRPLQEAFSNGVIHPKIF